MTTKERIDSLEKAVLAIGDIQRDLSKHLFVDESYPQRSMWAAERIKDHATLAEGLNKLLNLLVERESDIGVKDFESESGLNGWIYLAKNSSGHVKIGMTTDLKSRESNFKTSDPSIYMFASKPVMSSESLREKEKEVHTMCENYLITGEWFELPSHVLDSIVKTMGFNLYV